MPYNLMGLQTLITTFSWDHAQKKTAAKWELPVKPKMNGPFFPTIEQGKRKKKVGSRMRSKSSMSKIRKETKLVLVKTRNVRNSSRRNFQI